MEKVIAINVVWIVLIGGMIASTFSLYSREGVEGGKPGKAHFAANMQEPLKTASVVP